MLTVTLRSLENDGLISRESFSEIPPRVEYRLTSLGQSLIPYIENLAQWSAQKMPEIKKNRAKNESKPNVAIRD